MRVQDEGSFKTALEQQINALEFAPPEGVSLGVSCLNRIITEGKRLHLTEAHTLREPAINGLRPVPRRLSNLDRALRDAGLEERYEV